MKNLYLVTFLALFLSNLGHINAQNVAITDSTGYNAHNSAMLDVCSFSKGILIPRADTANISNPAKGLLVCDTTGSEVIFYFYDGSRWIDIATTGGGADSIWVENLTDSIVYLRNAYNKLGIGIDTPLAKLDVMGDTVFNAEDSIPLFVVRDKDGHEVFVVHPKGVFIYVDTLNNSSKATTNEQPTGFRVGKKTIGSTKGFDEEYFSVLPAAVADTIDPSEARVLWYPKKEAFMAGRVIVESPDSVGLNSWATGFESRAIGDYSQAMGYRSVARGDYSTAIGFGAITNCDYSVAIGDSSVAGACNSGSKPIVDPDSNWDYETCFAFGRKSMALGGGSVALGRFAKANGDFSFALGYAAFAQRRESYAIGRGARAEGFGSFAIGSFWGDSIGTVLGVSRAIGDYSFAIGQGSISEGYGAIALGLGDTARGGNSVAIGFNTTASGDFSTSMGETTIASGSQSTAMGSQTNAEGQYATALGVSTNALGSASTAMGYATTASGGHSTAMGAFTSALEYSSTALGSNTSSLSAYETVVGSWNTDYTPVFAGGWDENDRLFVVGNGTDYSQKSDAIVVLKNGNTGLGTSTPTAQLHTTGTLRFEGAGTPGSGRILTSDDDGNATWETPGTYMPTGTDGQTLRHNGSEWESTDRLYIDGVNIGIGTTFPAALLNTYGVDTGEGDVLFVGAFKSSDPGDPPASGGGTRLMWYPDKAAFRAGDVSGTQWDKSNIGDYSFASGANTVAGGNNATAMGFSTNAESAYETVLGTWNTDYSPASTTTWNTGDRLFVIGNGTDNGSRSNAVTVLKDGKTGLSTDTPSEVLDVNGNARVRSVASGAYSTSLNLTADGTFTTSTSDKRLKENIKPLQNSLDKVLKLQGVSFTWKKNPEMGTKIGFIAQEVKEILPELVFTNPADGYFGINYAEMSAVLVEALKEQQKIIEAQNFRLSELEMQNQLLQNYNLRISQIEKEFKAMKADSKSQVSSK